MGAFFFEAALFALKAFTVVGIFIVFFLLIASLVAARKNSSKESLEIEKINDQLDDFKKALEAETIPKDVLKIKRKLEKKEEKKEKKRLKKLQKKDPNILPENPKLFVLRFEGDLYASEVDTFRETITAILTIANTQDEVLVVLESPGGVVHCYGFAASQLQRIKDHNIKLTVAVDLVAASGGYMMASVADQIIAAPFSIVGSIGVLAQLPNFNRLLKKHDVDIEQHTAGEYKTTLTLLGENTDKSRAKFQEELKQTHNLFKQFIQKNRPQVAIDKIATGEHWYAQQALEFKLVDEIKTSDDYILEKSKNQEIFELSYIIQETLKEKISNALHRSTLKILQRLMYHLPF